MSQKTISQSPRIYRWIQRILSGKHIAPTKDTSGQNPNVRRRKLTPARKRSLLDFPTELLDFPTELLGHIFSYLPLPGRVCLALSSKYLYRLFNSALQAKELRFPLMPQDGEVYVLSEEYHQRMTLLTQLENKRWKGCGRCQKLHPRHEFQKVVLGRDSGPWDRGCMENAGIVDLCPCIALTLRDRTRIMEALTGRATEKRTLNYIKKGLLSLNQDKGGNPYLLHMCAYHRMYKIEIKLSLTESGQLVCSAHYQAWKGYSNSMAVPVCPHNSLSDFLRHPTLRDCYSCHAKGVEPSSPRNLQWEQLQVIRYLGRERWFADSEFVGNGNGVQFEGQWYNQCRKWKDYIPE